MERFVEVSTGNMKHVESQYACMTPNDLNLSVLRMKPPRLSLAPQIVF